jgi:AbrB family looped-hinge helix DNA binding protein
MLIDVTSRVGPKGEVVIPKVIRDQLGLGPGDEVELTLEKDAVRVRPTRRWSILRGNSPGSR